MAKVVLPNELARELAGGQKEVEVEAENFRQLLKALDARFPGVGDRLRDGVAVAIDGEIFQEPFLESIGEDSEVFFVPQIEAGYAVFEEPWPLRGPRC